MAKAKKAAKRGRGRPTELENGGSEYIGARVAKRMVGRINAWAKAQPDKPAKSAAVRQLLDSALTAAGY